MFRTYNFLNKIVQHVCLKNHFSTTTFFSGTNGEYLNELYLKWQQDPNSVASSWNTYFQKFKSFDSIQETTNDENVTAYLEELYDIWKANPKAVHSSWAEYFTILENTAISSPKINMTALPSTMPITVPSTKLDLASLNSEEKQQVEYLNVFDIVRRYQDRGHFLAKLDPLELKDNYKYRTYQSSRIPDESIFTKDQLSKRYLLPCCSFLATENSLPLSDIIKRCKEVYCKNVGLELSHIHDLQKLLFLRQKFETPGCLNLTKQEKLKLLEWLSQAHGFEAFLSKKWPSEKRFGLEGCDSAIPCMKACINTAVEMGVEYIIVGIAHRGRLNTLANICQSPLYRIFMQFMEFDIKEKSSGDVKYHLGISSMATNSSGKKYKISMVANPSHLELVNTVVLGKTKAEQFYKGDELGKKVMAILIHGDAAFAGEGMVQESLNISNLKYYNPQGVIHLVINNQVGFTTNPNRSRSSLYASDISKILNMPIFHVNGDCPEEASYIGKVCAEYRQTFQDNCIIDVIGYRKNGHNEADEPKFTQPHMYDVIRAHPPVFVKYSKELVEKKVLTENDVNKLVEKYDSLYESEYKKAQEQKEISLNDWNDSPWEDWKVPDTLTMSSTGITEDVAKHIATSFYTVPSGFEVHGAIQRILKTREDLTKKRLMDWAIGEAFAIGSLLKEGIHCRLSGEDVERGTFSHRHHVLHDQKLRKNVHISLKSLYPTQAEYTVTNSCLCELGLLGFELGYSLPNPNALVIWEAQFGDFANMAQPIVDTFVSSGETKWVRQSGLVILLPHGMEGQGPEHSSGRIERYLELCSEDEDFCPPDDANFVLKQLNEINWIVANCTTPANIFHILRRQIAMPFRKPLVVFTPKSLLRNPLARSSFDDILVGTEFQRIIPDRGPASQKPEDVKKLIFCSGKVYYEIVQLLEEKKLQDQIAVTRIEQYCPFPFDLVKAEFNKYPKANIFYAQEEHKNQGAYHYVRPRISTSIGGARPVQYIGRDVSAAPSNGNKVIQKRELKKLQADLIAL